MKEIDSDVRTIKELLNEKKYTIDFYQREYRWERKHVAELINDLSDAFLKEYDPSHSRLDVKGYDQYFIGSIIISDEDGHRFIVDGQQRLTTLTLLLVYLYNSPLGTNHRDSISRLIFSEDYGQRSYNLDVEERNVCMDHLFKGEELPERAEDDLSVKNILARYNDIDGIFPEEISQVGVFDNFVDWLLGRVCLVDITADSGADAYAIFETMNDRGMSLTPAEMLRGYLLANIMNSELRRSSTNSWDGRIRDLQRLGKDEDSDAIKSWLRSQHAKSIRVGSRGASPLDFDLIGTEFHRWVKDSEDSEDPIGLESSSDFAAFVERDFDFYGRWYGEMRLASKAPVAGLEPFFYVGQTNFTLQYMAAMAPLVPTDDDATVARKLRTVAAFIECVLNRRIWNGKAISHSSMRVPMFRDVTLKIRHQNEKALAETLCGILDGYSEQFVRNDFSLHGMNGPKIHQMLARMTDYVDSRSGRPSLYRDYLKRWGRGHYQIEHVLSESLRDGFEDFDYHRNKIGALVLLPGRVNASIGDMPYGEKREHYLKQNLLAASLHDLAHSNDPGFRRFKEDTGLDFKPYEVFNPKAINERQELYRQLAMRIWSTDSIREAADIV